MKELKSLLMNMKYAKMKKIYLESKIKQYLHLRIERVDIILNNSNVLRNSAMQSFSKQSNKSFINESHSLKLLTSLFATSALTTVALCSYSPLFATTTSASAESSEIKSVSFLSTELEKQEKEKKIIETRKNENGIIYQVSDSPRIYVADSVFSKEECKRLIDSGNYKLREAGVMGKDGIEIKDANAERKYRNAEAVGLTENDGEIVSLFRERMSNIALMPELNGETLQLTRYKPGQYYDIHFDSSPQVGRLVTVLVFLTDVEEGGYLAFPWAKLYQSKFERNKIDGIIGTGRDVKELEKIDKEPSSEQLCKPDSNSLLIEPRAGRVVVFFNHHPNLKRESYRAMHCGCPVIQGEKYIAQLWIDWYEPGKQNEFEALLKKAKVKQWQVDPVS